VKNRGETILSRLSFSESSMRRARVDSLLQNAMTRQVAMIVAGPGCGKTFAAYSFLRNSDVRTTWMQVTEADNSPSVFWETFCSATAQVNPEFAEFMRQNGFPSSTERYTRIEDQVIDSLKPRFSYAVVFDDVHLIHDEAVLSFLTQLASRPVAGVTIFFIAREPTITSYDLGIEDDEVVLIDEKDLLFTKKEIADYLAMLHVGASAALVDSIAASTEGLAYLVNLAGKLLMKNPDARVFIQSAIRSNITRLISDQFFADLPDEIKDFLAKLSLIDHLSEELVTTIGGGRDLITDAMRRTSLIRYDSYMGTFHVHHLLKEFLEGQHDRISEEEKVAVYEAAAQWCLGEGLKLEAIGYYQKMHDYKAIVDTIVSMNLEIDFHEGAFLLKIFEEAPEQFYKDYPAACMLHTRTLLSLGRFDDAKDALLRYIARFEEGTLTAGKAQALMWLYINLGFTGILTSTETGNYDFAKSFEKAYEYMSFSDYVEGLPTMDALICPYACLVGNNKAGEPERYIEAVEKAVHFAYHTMGGCLYGSDDLTRAEVAYFRGDMQECERYAMTATFKAREKGQTEIENRALFYLLRQNLFQGRYKRIEEILQQLDEVVARSASSNRYTLNEIVKSWFYAAIEEREGIATWVKSDFLGGEKQAYVMGLEDITKCRYYIMEKNYHTLIAFIERRPRTYGIYRYLFGRIGLKVYEAIAHHQLKDKAAALECLREAYELSAPNGLISQFIEMGNAMRTLTGMALKEKDVGIPQDWLETIRSKSATYAKRVAHVRSEYRLEHHRQDSVPLTAKEKAILFDLTQGLSRTEIAVGRGISINTVKVMLPIIFEKIGADNSIDAVRIALSKNLLAE